MTSARLDGLAREQLSQGKGTWSVVHELVRIGRIDRSEARDIVDRVRPSVIRENRPRRGPFLFGVLILMIPLSIVGTVLLGEFSQFGVFSRSAVTDALWMLVFPPMLFFEVVGVVLIVRGWTLMQHSKNTFTPDTPGGPASTGLWWRADPFEWK